MVRVVWWNMLNFSNSKFSNPRSAVAVNVGRLDHILSVFLRTAPDIFVMLELGNRSLAQYEGSLLPDDTAAGHGALQLLNYIRTNVNILDRLDWCMVPPIITGHGGKAEGIGVYYNSRRVKFVGPWMFNGQTTGVSIQNQKDYPGDPNQLTWAWAAYGLINGQRGLNRHGGQWNYDIPNKTNAGAKKAKTTISKNFPTSVERTPWLTTFEDRANNNIIDIWSMHCPPPASGQHPPAAQAIQVLSGVDEFDRSPMQADIQALGGDFNVDSNNQNQVNNSYALLGQPGYTWLFDQPPAGGIYYKTSIKFQLFAKLSMGGFPDYQYGSSAYDQIFVKPGNQGARQRIINPVAGSNNNFSGSPIAGGNYGYPGQPPGQGGTVNFTTRCGMTQDLATILATNNIDGNFKRWDNYSGQRSTSDHLAVVAELG